MEVSSSMVVSSRGFKDGRRIVVSLNRGVKGATGLGVLRLALEPMEEGRKTEVLDASEVIINFCKYL